jgi:adenine-specific DNA-methyltransferase
MQETTTKGAYEKISDITLDRLKKVIDKENISDGFRVFKLVASNYRIWENNALDKKELTTKLQLFKSPLIDGYKKIDLIYECIIKEGFELNSKIDRLNIKTNEIYKVSDEDSYFLICIDSKISDGTLNNLSLKKETKFICLDSALDDSQKTNLALQCDLKII